jgi:GT2 family glycosyltransferase
VSENPPVAVVIPAWNSADVLVRCLDSLAVADEDVELLVIDNGSTDGTTDLLTDRGVEYVRVPRNLGFAAAVNLGVARTSAPDVLALNADTVVQPEAIGRLAAALAADPGLGGVQPRILQFEGGGFEDVESARLYSTGMALRKDGRAVETGAGEAQTPRYGVSREVFGVCGAACMLRREMLSTLGGFDETFFSFYEDVDLNVRARIAGWRFRYEPVAVVWHIGGASWQEHAPRPAAWNARLVARNRIVTQARFMPVTTLPRIAIVETGALARAAQQRRFRSTLMGKVEGLLRLPSAFRDRRRLRREGDLRRVRLWLGAI